MSASGTVLENVDETSSYYSTLEVPDRHRQDSQKFAIISVVSPDGLGDRCKDVAIRIYGTRATLEEANTYARELRDSNSYWNYYSVPLHEWAPLPPRIEDIADVQYTSSRVQEIHDSYKIHLKGHAKDMADRLAMVDGLRQKEKAALAAAVEVDAVPEDAGAEESKSS